MTSQVEHISRKNITSISFIVRRYYNDALKQFINKAMISSMIIIILFYTWSFMGIINTFFSSLTRALNCEPNTIELWKKS